MKTSYTYTSISFTTCLVMAYLMFCTLVLTVFIVWWTSPWVYLFILLAIPQACKNAATYVAEMESHTAPQPHRAPKETENMENNDKIHFLPRLKAVDSAVSSVLSCKGLKTHRFIRSSYEDQKAYVRGLCYELTRDIPEAENTVFNLVMGHLARKAKNQAT